MANSENRSFQCWFGKQKVSLIQYVMRAVRSNTMCSSLELFPAVRVKLKKKKKSEKATETDTDIDADYPLSHFTSRDCRSISTSERERERETEGGLGWQEQAMFWQLSLLWDPSQSHPALRLEKPREKERWEETENSVLVKCTKFRDKWRKKTHEDVQNDTRSRATPMAFVQRAEWKNERHRREGERRYREEAFA